MDGKNSISESLKQLAILQKNIISFFQKLNSSLISSNETVSVDYTKDDGTTATLDIPSFGYLKDQVSNLNNKIEELININDNSIGLQFQDGTVRKFKVDSVNQVIKDLEKLQDSTFSIPTDFRIKNNWFFESFLNPLLFITLDISQYISSSINEIDSFAVKRIIVKIDTTTDSEYFDTQLKGKTDIELNQLLNDLNGQNIKFFTDDETVDLSIAINRIRGNFSVLKKFQEEIITTNADGTTSTVTRIKYKLDKLTYTDILDGKENTKTLKVDDILITSNGTEYKVNSINKDDNTVILTRVFGKETPSIGVDVFTIKSVILRIPELQINIGYNERQIIFIKPISRTQKLTIDKYSKGIAFHSNDLSITLSDGSITKLDTYYNNFVDDFGLLFINFAKDRNIPSILGVIPDSTALDLNNFKVVQINNHLKENKDNDQLKTKIANKERLQNEINELNKTIETNKAKLNTAEITNESERQNIRNTITNLNTKKTNLFTQVSTLVKEITLDLKNAPTFQTDPKYRVRGFWNIPGSKETEVGKQEIIQFKISYRYISKKGTANNVDQLKFIDTDGAERTGFFSNWNEYTTKIRAKEFNQNTGKYEWSSEKVDDPQAVNINQLDIPITKGESVEIRIKSISEAGYPINPIESDWSNTVNIPFPDDLENTIESSVLSKDIQAEDIQIKFQEELNARSLDIHVLNAFTTGDKYYSHRTEDIASGFTTNQNIVINLYDKLKEMQDRISALETSLKKDKGVIKVTITDEVGNIIEVKNGQTISLFAGFYKDLIAQTIDNTTTYKHGKIITKTYIISISNSSSTPLELISRVTGGIDEQVSDDLTPDYTGIRKYHLTTLSVLTLSDGTTKDGFKFKAPYQSNHAKSQFIYTRYKSYGLNNNLYTVPSTPFNTLYNYEGVSDPANANHKIPLDGVHYLPFNPALPLTGSMTNANIWNGINNVNTPLGQGYLTEFSIHKDHPDLPNLDTNFYWSDDKNDFMRPVFTDYNTTTGNATQKYIPISHAYNFDTSISDSSGYFGGSSEQQLEYYDTLGPDNASEANNTTFAMYPAKLGFSPNDEYLVGKFTCGSYLFMAPSKYEDISIEGNNLSIARRVVESGTDNAINIPIVYQFRCSDKLEYVGGYRLSGNITNIEYRKTIGLDIYLKDQNTFSFDIDIKCKYNKDISILTPIDIPATGTLLRKITFTSGI